MISVYKIVPSGEGLVKAVAMESADQLRHCKQVESFVRDDVRIILGVQSGYMKIEALKNIAKHQYNKIMTATTPDWQPNEYKQKRLIG